MGRLEEEHLVNNPLERIRALEIQLKELQRNALTSVEAVGGVTDHGSLTGLGDDDHTQYVLADGSRSFTGTVGGVTPSAASDLATKGYVDTAPWTDHGNLIGLGDDDHSQYVHISSARTITAQHAFAPTSTQAPFTLGANAQGQLVTGLNADQVDGQDLGASDSPTFAGLTISGNITVSGTVDGVDVSDLKADVDGFPEELKNLEECEIQQLQNINSTTISATQWGYLGAMNQGVATTDSPTFAGMAVSGLTASRLVATNGSKALASVSNLASWIGGTANQVYVADDGDGTITLSGPQDLNTSSSPTFAGITVNGNASMRHVLPQATDTYDLGSQTLLWRKGYLSEMEAVLFAENTITLIGGWLYVCKYAGTVEEDVDGTETAVDLGVSDSVLSVNDFIVFRSSLQVEYMQLTSYAGSNVWNVTRDVDGSGANTWPQGSPFAVLGCDGDGRIEFSAYDTPRASIVGQGTSYNSQTEYVRMGDLNGMADYTSQAFGIFIGDYAGDSWMAYDPTNGLRMDGSAIIDGTIQATSFTTDLSAMFFSSSDGLLLLGPGCRITPTEWESTRGEIATISGAFHQVTGRWAGTLGLVVEEETENLVTDPSVERHASSWSALDSATISQSDDYARYGNYSLKVVTNGNAYAGAQYNPDISVSASTTYAISFWIHCAVAGISMRARFNFDHSGNADVTFTSAIGWQRVTGTITADGSDTKISYVRITHLNDATNHTFYIDAYQVEEKDYATTYCDGSLGTGYSWSGTAHASASTRTDTEINMDDHVGLISGNDTVSISMWVQMPYDYDDFNRSGGTGTIFFSAGGGSNALAIQYNSSTYKFRLLAGASSNVSLYSSAQSFSAGDWMHIVTTSDFSSNEHKIYVDGVLDGTDTTSESAPTLTDWELGSVNGGTQYGWAFCECAAFDTILDEGDVAAIFYRNAPLVDTGSLNKPGIYILDGRFSMMSSVAGEHIEITEAGMGIYDGTGPTGIGRILGGFVDTTAKVLGITSGDLGWFGYDASDVLQVAWYGSGSNAGQIVAGSGKVILSEDGVLIDSTATVGNLWFGATGSGACGSIYGDGATEYILTLYVQDAETGANQDTAVIQLKTGATDFFRIWDNPNGGANLLLNLNTDGDLSIEGGLAVGGSSINPAVGSILCTGDISTDGGTTKWDFGGYTAGAPTVDGYATVEINGSTYRFACEAVV